MPQGLDDIDRSHSEADRALLVVAGGLDYFFTIIDEIPVKDGFYDVNQDSNSKVSVHDLQVTLCTFIKEVKRNLFPDLLDAFLHTHSLPKPKSVQAFANYVLSNFHDRISAPSSKFDWQPVLPLIWSIVESCTEKYQTIHPHENIKMEYLDIYNDEEFRKRLDHDSSSSLILNSFFKKIMRKIKKLNVSRGPEHTDENKVPDYRKGSNTASDVSIVV